MVTQVVAKGRFLPLGTATTLPATLANALTRYTFVTHATYGATLSTVEDLSGAGFTWTNAQASDDGSVTGRLWEIGLMGASEGMSPFSEEFSSEFGIGARTVAPSSTADVFTTTDEDDRPALMFRWEDVLIPNTDGSSSDYVTVYACVALGTTDTFARWRLFAHRTGEPLNTIETITFPMLALVGPVATRSGSTHVVSQNRARVHVPEQLSPTLRASNTPLQVWVAAALEWDHPSGTAAARQTMSFPLATVWAGDPEDTASFGRMFHFGADDRNGYLKTFAHRGELTGATTLLSVWSHAYYPVWGAPPFGLADATQFGTEFRAPYPVITGVQVARSWSWWMDACEFYREQFVQASGRGGDRRVHRRGRASLTRLDGQWLGCIRFADLEGIESPGTLYDRCQTMGTDLLEILGAAPSDGFWQLQNILNPVARHGDSTGVLNPDYPISASVDALVPPCVAAIQALGGHVACYTDGLNTEVEAGWLTDADAQSNMRVLYRNGLPNEADNFRWDYGDPTAQAYQTQRMYRDLRAFCGFDGFYIDAISGGNGRVSDFSQTHLAHGGYHHTKGRRRFLELVRAELPAGGFVMSEVAEEGIHDLLDVIQDQHSPAMLSMLAEETIYTALGFPLGITDQNAIAREMNPPAWQAVYSQYAACGHIGTMLNTRARADHPDNLGVGLTPTAWNEYLSFSVAFIAQNGTKPLWQLVDDNYDDRILEATHGAAGIGLFLKALWALWTEQAPEFLLGEMLRPFEIDYADSELDLRTNPISTLATVPDTAGPGIYPQYINATSPFALAFQVPSVLHSFWRDPESGDMALILFNWSAVPASWVGTFSPWTHDGGARGFSSEFSDEFVHGTAYDIEEISTVPVVTPLLAGTSAATTIHCNSNAASSGDDLYVGTVPAYSIRVFRFSLT